MPAIFIQLLLLEECILHSACAGCLREQECFLGSYLSPFFHFCLLLSFTNNKNEKLSPVSCCWRVLTICDPVKASVVLTSESSCWFFPSVFDHKQGEWWCCVWVWGSYAGMDLCDPVLQTSFVAPLFCDLGQESSHKYICIKYVGSWFCLYHVRSCLMNNHQKRVMFWISPQQKHLEFHLKMSQNSGEVPSKSSVILEWLEWRYLAVTGNFWSARR